MAQFVARRLLQSLITLAILSLVIFFLARSTGDPLMLILPMEATAQDRINASHELGLDRPLAEQYAHFISDAVQGNFGTSLYYRRPVNELILERLPNSVRLASFAMGVAILIAFPLGVVAAVHKDKAIDRIAQVIAILGQSLPSFCVAIVLVEYLAGRLDWFPAGGIGGLDHYILPGFAIGWFIVAGIMRLVRSGMIDVLDSDFVKLARIKGAPEYRVIWVHALKNALIPVLTFMSVYFTTLVTTAIVVETVFAWPGIGRLVYEGIKARDFPIIQAVVLVTAILVAVVNLTMDCLYGLLDPRIRHAR